MTDYQEEQRNELEALESIYPEEFTGMSSQFSCSVGLLLTLSLLAAFFGSVNKY